MKNSLLRFPLVLLVAGSAGWLHANDDSFHAPDSLVLKNGNVIHGLILKNTKDAIIIQEKFGENTYPKGDIVRIRDEANVNIEYTDINRKGELPAWRVIANDLRLNDNIHSLVEVPATIIDTGDFKNIPYISFRANKDIELNIYGDPEDPAAIEMGIYGFKSGIPRLRRTLRAYLAGFLSTKEEVAALYSLPFTGGKKTVGNITLEITPKSAPDSYGAWWITLYNKAELDRVRLDDAEYAKLVRPMSEVWEGNKLRANAWSDEQLEQSQRIRQANAQDGVILRGFYRDQNGDFRLITDKAVIPSKVN